MCHQNLAMLNHMRPEDLVFAAAAFTPRRQESAGEKDSDRKRSASMSEACEQTARVDRHGWNRQNHNDPLFYLEAKVPAKAGPNQTICILNCKLLRAMGFGIAIRCIQQFELSGGITDPQSSRSLIVSPGGTRRSVSELETFTAEGGCATEKQQVPRTP
jgi:hypothetical protein